MRFAIACCLLLVTSSLPAKAAPVTRDISFQLDQAREGYLASLPRPISAHDWDARFRSARWFWEAQPSDSLRKYEKIVQEVAKTAQAPDPGDPYFRRKAIWVRPYASDAIDLRVLEVLDRAQALGMTEVYLETFYHGQVSYLGSRTFPPRWPKLNVAKVYAREAHHRGMKLYAWVHALRWGEEQVQSGWAEGVANGYGDSPIQAEGRGSAFVSPSSPKVAEKLGALLEEISDTGYFDGIWLDYLRYPLAARSRPSQGDPRLYWGFAPSTRTAFRRKRPDLDTSEFRTFLNTGLAPNPDLRSRWMSAWRSFLAGELQDLVAVIREKVPPKVKLGLVFHPSSYLNEDDVRAQDALRWLPYFDEASPMCYAYDPDLDPVDASRLRATIDKELSSVEQFIAAMPGKKPELIAALAGEPQPGSPELTPPRRHWPLSAQVAYLKGRRVEGAFRSLGGVALFSYGWLWPASDASRRATDAPWSEAGRSIQTPQ
ncbi:MAG: hypothetical protein VKN33_10050 [Candidatus Sericytochromatia bacterium]|nr:hypothetical protein [Candidatus Sericytochromatia bacterium]